MFWLILISASHPHRMWPILGRSHSSIGVQLVHSSPPQKANRQRVFHGTNFMKVWRCQFREYLLLRKHHSHLLHWICNMKLAKKLRWFYCYEIFIFSSNASSQIVNRFIWIFLKSYKYCHLGNKRFFQMILFRLVLAPTANITICC